MDTGGADIRDFLKSAGEAVAVTVALAKGSTPREAGTVMLVSTEAIHGTIGGGQLEYMAIDHARRMLADAISEESLELPLGPEIGQCCGGHVRLELRRVDEAMTERLVTDADCDHRNRPHVYLFGAGHVGHALAEALTLLPVKTIIVDNRENELRGFGKDVETRLAAMPEASVRDAPSGSAYVVLTHDHALDFLIVTEALKRRDAAYVGMIGSKTKRATFKSWFLKNGGTAEQLSSLVSPIGGGTMRDKRPAVIAALAAAEIMAALIRFQTSDPNTAGRNRLLQSRRNSV